MNKASKEIRASLRKNNTLPTFISMKDMDTGKKHDISKPQYAGLFEAQNVFWKNHSRQPNYTSLVSTANNPLISLRQHYKMSCCPTSLAMATQLLYDYKTENECINALGTQKYTTGTSPSMLINGAKKIGYTVKQIPRNRDAVKNALKLNMPVIMHIQTKPAKCLGFLKDYGHYILCYGLDGDYYKVMCPTKGKHTCKTSILDNATGGRSIGYYRVSIA